MSFSISHPHALECKAKVSLFFPWHFVLFLWTYFVCLLEAECINIDDTPGVLESRFLLISELRILTGLLQQSILQMK